MRIKKIKKLGKKFKKEEELNSESSNDHTKKPKVEVLAKKLTKKIMNR